MTSAVNNTPASLSHPSFP